MRSHAFLREKHVTGPTFHPTATTTTATLPVDADACLPDDIHNFHYGDAHTQTHKHRHRAKANTYPDRHGTSTRWVTDCVRYILSGVLCRRCVTVGGAAARPISGRRSHGNFTRDFMPIVHDYVGRGYYD